MAEHGVDRDNFSLWHKCRRWRERGLTCPFDRLEEEEVTADEDARARPSGAAALARAVGAEAGFSGFAGALELLGPLLALFTVLRGIQTLGPGLKMGRVQAAGVAEEATVRVLKPQVPAKEGPRPSRPTRPPVKVPVPVGISRTAAPRSGGAGGFFFKQAQEMRSLLK